MALKVVVRSTFLEFEAVGEKRARQSHSMPPQHPKRGTGSDGAAEEYMATLWARAQQLKHPKSVQELVQAAHDMKVSAQPEQGSGHLARALREGVLLDGSKPNRRSSSTSTCCTEPIWCDGEDQKSDEDHTQELDAALEQKVPVTTVMLKNLPFSMTAEQLRSIVEAEGFAQKFDFLNLPVTFNKKTNLGYAFINLICATEAALFVDVFNGRRLSAGKNSAGKICSVSAAHRQGYNSSLAQLGGVGKGGKQAKGGKQSARRSRAPKGLALGLEALPTVDSPCPP